MEQIFADEAELVAVVNEIAGARPQQDIDGKTTLPNGLADEGVTGGEAVHAQAGTELNACGAVSFGQKAGVERLGTQLEDDVLHGRKHEGP